MLLFLSVGGCLILLFLWRFSSRGGNEDSLSVFFRFLSSLASDLCIFILGWERDSERIYEVSLVSETELRLSIFVLICFSLCVIDMEFLRSFLRSSFCSIIGALEVEGFALVFGALKGLFKGRVLGCCGIVLGSGLDCWGGRFPAGGVSVGVMVASGLTVSFLWSLGVSLIREVGDRVTKL